MGAGTPQDGTEPFSLLEAVGACMRYLALDFDGGADVVPSGELMHGQYITGFEWNVISLIAVIDCIADVDRFTVDHDLCASLDLIAGKVSVCEQGIPPEATSHAHELGCRHTVRERVAAGPQDFKRVRSGREPPRRGSKTGSPG